MVTCPFCEASIPWFKVLRLNTSNFHTCESCGTKLQANKMQYYSVSAIFLLIVFLAWYMAPVPMDVLRPWFFLVLILLIPAKAFLTKVDQLPNQLPDPDKIVSAAESGVAEAQFTLGDMLQYGEGVEQNYEEALFWFRKAADQDFLHANNKIGLFYENGWGVPQDYPEAAHWFRRGAELGHSTAQFNIGMHYERIGDLDEAIRWYRLAGELGNSTAQFKLGDMYQKGQGVKMDYSEAMKWLTLAAEQGEIDAQFILGAMYAEGECVTPDYSQAIREAVKWLQSAAENGHVKAQVNLGAMYAEGRPADHMSAMEWWKRGGDQKDRSTEGFSAVFEGQALKPNYRKARKWFRLAAEQGDPDGQRNLAMLEREGI